MKERLTIFEPLTDPEFYDFPKVPRGLRPIAEEAGRLTLRAINEGSVRTEATFSKPELVDLDAASRGLTAAESGAERSVTERAVRFNRESIFAELPGKTLTGIIYERLLTGDIEFIPDDKNDISPRLTASEQRVAELVCSGMTNAEAIEILYISRSTLKFHLVNIRKKVNAKNRAHIPRRLFETGIYELPR